MPVKKRKRRSKKPSAERKKRTRQHVIADLSANHVERFALLNGFSVESIAKDYGYDLNIFTFDAKGEFENGNIYVQLKATDKPKQVNRETEVSFLATKKDLRTWYDEPFPVIFILYDAKHEVAYWVYTQPYLRSLANFDLAKATDNFVIRIPKANVVNVASLQRFRGCKANTLK